MTNAKLISKHYAASNVSDGWGAHVDVSILYAISVLEELRDYLMSIHHHNSAAHTENKIEELKKLLS